MKVNERIYYFSPLMGVVNFDYLANTMRFLSASLHISLNETKDLAYCLLLSQEISPR